MNKFSDFITKHSKNILIITIVLLVFSFIGMKMTKINYDILVYLPNNYETIKGQNILTDEFKMGSYSTAVLENANAPSIAIASDLNPTAFPVLALCSPIIKAIRSNKHKLIIIFIFFKSN